MIQRSQTGLWPSRLRKVRKVLHYLHFNIILPSTAGCPKWFIPYRFPDCEHLQCLPHVKISPSISFLIRQSASLLITKSSSASCYFLLLRHKCFHPSKSESKLFPGFLWPGYNRLFPSGFHLRKPPIVYIMYIASNRERLINCKII